LLSGPGVTMTATSKKIIPANGLCGMSLPVYGLAS